MLRPMSASDLELVSRWYEAGPRDLAAAFTNERFIAAARPTLEGFLAPDVVFLAGEDDFTGLAGEYHGLDGFLDFMATATARGPVTSRTPRS
jgi:hypothetical protein